MQISFPPSRNDPILVWFRHNTWMVLIYLKISAILCFLFIISLQARSKTKLYIGLLYPLYKNEPEDGCLLSPSDEIGRGILFWRCPSVRQKFVSALFLCNCKLDFNDTLWEPSIPRGDAHFVVLFRSDFLTQSYGPLIIYAGCI
jgi:hypothetical protein